MLHRLKMHHIEEDGENFLYLDLEYRPSEKDNWVLYGFVSQNSALEFLVSVNPNSGEAGDTEEMEVPDLETGLNALMHIYNARINKQ